VLDVSPSDCGSLANHRLITVSGNIPQAVFATYAPRFALGLPNHPPLVKVFLYYSSIPVAARWLGVGHIVVEELPTRYRAGLSVVFW